MPVHEKNIAFGYRKTRYCYLAILYLFSFSAIIFLVDSCESYATLDTAKGEKSGTMVTTYPSMVSAKTSQLIEQTSLFEGSTLKSLVIF